MNAPPASAELASVEALISGSRFAEAVEACSRILSHDPSHPLAQFFRAFALSRLSRLDEARAQLNALLRDEPTMLPASYLLADVDRANGRARDALARYGESLAREFSLPAVTDAGSLLLSLFEFVATAPLARWANRYPAFQAYGFALGESDAGRLIGENVLKRMGASSLALSAGGDFRNRFLAACALLGVTTQSAPQWMQRVFEAVLLQWIERALQADLYDNALEIENSVYASLVLQVETEEHFRDCFARWMPSMRAAGKRYAASLPALARRGPGVLPRVAFFVQNLTLLAHAKTLLEVLEGHAELPEPMIEPYVFYLSADAQTPKRFRDAGVRVEPLLGEAAIAFRCAALERLRRRIAEEGIDVLAWVSLAVTMPFAFAMRLAPRQVWWAMKYHALEFAEIDDYVTGGSQTGGTKTIHGRRWRVGPVASADWYSPELSEEARRVRSTLGAAGIVYGSFGREEKLNSPAFLDAAIEILRSQPEATFLWTGRSALESIQQRFEAGGVAKCCRFIGWVNTKLYAQVIDVFLDSFPFPCGFTLYEAMAAGKPVVLYESAESTHGGINAIIEPLLRADPGASAEARLAHDIFRPRDAPPLYLRAATSGEYVAYALSLARDAALRARAGAAGREFIERLMMDRRGAARIYLDHLLGR